MIQIEKVRLATSRLRWSGLLRSSHWKAIAEAAQKAREFERSSDVEQAQAWRRIEAALMLMRSPSES